MDCPFQLVRYQVWILAGAFGFFFSFLLKGRHCFSVSFHFSLKERCCERSGLSIEPNSRGGLWNSNMWCLSQVRTQVMAENSLAKWDLCTIAIVDATQPSHSVDRAGWLAKMASIEVWIPWRNSHGPHSLSGVAGLAELLSFTILVCKGSIICTCHFILYASSFFTMIENFENFFFILMLEIEKLPWFAN